MGSGVIELQPRLDDTEQRLEWKIASMLGSGVMPGAKPSPAPPASFSYEPPTALIIWEDANGVFGPVDRATFFATADIPTVDTVVLDNQGVTSVTAPQALPALVSFSSQYNSTDSLSFVGCANLTNIHVDFSGLSSLTVSNCPVLFAIAASLNYALTTVTVAGLVTLNLLNLNNCSLTVQSVNTILSQLVALGNTGGQLLLQAQTPAAPPSVGPPNGIVAKAALLAETPAWAVVTD